MTRSRSALSAVVASLAGAALAATLIAPVSGANAQDASDRGERRDGVPWGQPQDDTLNGPSRAYTFSVTQSATARFVLGNLSANYDVSLADPTGKVIKQSRKPGTAYEQIVAKVAPGDYTLTVTAVDAVTPDPYRLIGTVHTKPEIINRNLYSVPDGQYTTESQYVVEFINPTGKTMSFTAELEVYDAQGGYVDTRDIESEFYAPKRKVGLAATSHYYSYGWFDPGYTVKMVNPKFAPVECEPKYLVKTKNVEWTGTEDTDEYKMTGMATNPRKTQATLDGLWAARDAMGMPYEVNSQHLVTTEGKRTASFSNFSGNTIYTLGGPAPHSWTLDGYVRYGC